ncbi:hypothetical protein [Poriferisphaera sp. WC338]|uniref:hypothetical protein n=1 Tax=Poriferisphaera sp. WC338 TaxID=3425129 RepID=UPI003D8157E4
MVKEVGLKRSYNMIDRNGKIVRYLMIAKGCLYLAAGIAFLLSVSLWFTGNHLEGVFVATWVPSILVFGLILLWGKDGD